MIAFTVLGRPQPAGSKRAFAVRKGGVPTGRVAITDDAKKSRPWKQEVAGAARIAFYEDAGHRRPSALLTGPVTVRVEFFFARPKGHYGTGRNARVVKASAPDFPAVKPDIDKLSRAVMDALTGVVWRDDAQVVTKLATKRYGTPERCEIAVRELEQITETNDRRAAA